MYEAHRAVRFLERESKKVAIRVWDGGTGELVFSGYRVYVGNGEEIWRWKVEIVAQLSE